MKAFELGMKVKEEKTGKVAVITRIVKVGERYGEFGMWGGIEVEFEDNSKEVRFSWEIEPYEENTNINA